MLTKNRFVASFLPISAQYQDRMKQHQQREWEEAKRELMEAMDVHVKMDFSSTQLTITNSPAGTSGGAGFAALTNMNSVTTAASFGGSITAAGSASMLTSTKPHLQKIVASMSTVIQSLNRSIGQGNPLDLIKDCYDRTIADHIEVRGSSSTTYGAPPPP